MYLVSEDTGAYREPTGLALSHGEFKWSRDKSLRYDFQLNALSIAAFWPLNVLIIVDTGLLYLISVLLIMVTTVN